MLVCFLIVVMMFKKSMIEDENRFISRAQAARMFSMFEEEIYNSDEDESQNWYYKYMMTLKENNRIVWKGSVIDDNFAIDGLRYDELRTLMTSYGFDIKDAEKNTSLKINKKRANKTVEYKDFCILYNYLVLYKGNEYGITKRNLQIVGTPTSMSSKQIGEFGKWTCQTMDGKYYFDGLALDSYLDKTISVYTKNREIIYVIDVVSSDAEYKNVWIDNVRNDILTIFINGIYRQFNVSGITDNIDNLIADIYITNGKLTNIILKKDTINGKVLSVTDEYIEIEGYGKVYLDEGFQVYKNYGVFEKDSSKSILVGYDIEDFVVANGKISAAIINRELLADNIRVLIMSTNYESLFHERISLTCDAGMVIRNDTKEFDFEPGEIIDIYPGCDYLEGGRITIESNSTGAKISVLNINRSYGNPLYSGQLEIAESDGCLVLINEIPIEEYLFYVVPSEMPIKFGVEALKVQAVCARSYAYNQLKSNSYRKYGAHVDDSVNFQVYNNVSIQPASTQAVKETYGQVICKNDEIVSTYYYSTSCGITSDLTLWNSDGSDGIYVTKTVNNEHKSVDLSDENEFKNFILSKSENDFDYEFPYYRWRVNISKDELSANINSLLTTRFGAKNSDILCLDDYGNYVMEENIFIGKLEKLFVEERTNAGAIKQLKIVGSDNTVLVRGELNIRYLLAPMDNMLKTNLDTEVEFYILPSTYVCFEEFTDEEEGESYCFLGGGYGHGIGMSQNAVSTMVKSGMKYDHIINFFYENVSIKNIY